jgi:hypothetical protein
MSDTLRKGLGEQAGEKRKLFCPHLFPDTVVLTASVTPDSSKSTTQKASENVSGLGDKAASAVQPGTSHPLTQPSPSVTDTSIEGNKSATQKVGDSARSGGDSAQNQGSSVLGSAQETLQNAGQSISDAVSGGQKK